MEEVGWVGTVSFGYWHQRRRKALDLTRGELAQRVGCSPVTIKKIERDERRPSRQLAELLADQLSVPEVERDSFVRMARGQFVPSMTSPLDTAAIPLPPFLQTRDEPSNQEDLPFVGRAQELSKLEAALNTARAGAGQVLFVIGGAGRGKTVLVQEFARRMQEADPDLIVMTGDCNAHTGVGDPYLPFREALALLTGDVEARWAGGLISPQHARRLWEMMPLTIPALAKHGPDLIDSFVPRQELQARAATFAPENAPWFDRLAQIIPADQSTTLEQKRIFAQYATVLKTIAIHRPLLLVIEDLQWADTSSSALLFHLSRQMADSRILMIGTYRPEEVALSRRLSTSIGPEEQHPLADIVSELKRRHGDIWLDLGEMAPVEGRHFVEAYLDTQPNRLGEAFREKLFQHTQGHALFTVELLRDMQERGDLDQDESGHWVEGPAIDWQTLPVKVEGVIERRINRLKEKMQAVLTIASVEGEIFTAEVVACVQELNERELVQQLSRELDIKHRLVTAQAFKRMGQQRLSRYRFRHHLFQHYLYHRLDKMERAYLHEAVGQALEALYGEQTEQIAVQLAQHFQEAGRITQAITYLRQAGDRARQLFALAEALEFYSRAIELVQGQPQALDPQTRLGLYEHRGQTYSLTGQFDQAVADLQLVRQAAQDAADAPRERAVLIRLGQVFRKAEEHDEAVQHLTEALDVSRAMEDQRAVADALYHRGTVIWDEGDNMRAREHHQEAVDICRKLGLTDIVTVQALHGLGETSWMAGEPDLAITLLGESLTLARQIGDKSYEAENLQMMGFASIGTMGKADYRQAQEYFNQSLAISEAVDLVWHSVATLNALGLAQGCTGDYERGLATVRRSLTMAESFGLRRYRTVALDQLGYLLMDLNLLDEATEAFTLGIDLALQTNFNYWLPRLQAHRAISRLRQGDLSVETDLQNALALARRNGQGIHAAHCLEGLAELTIALDEPASAMPYADELLALAEPQGLREMVAQAHRWRGEAMLAVGQLDAVEEELKQAADLATEIDRVRLRWDIHEALRRLYQLQGQTELAERHEMIVRSIVTRISDNLQEDELRTGLPL